MILWISMGNRKERQCLGYLILSSRVCGCVARIFRVKEGGGGGQAMSKSPFFCIVYKGNEATQYIKCDMGS